MENNEISQLHYAESPKTKEQLTNYINTNFDAVNYPQTAEAVLDFYANDDEIAPGTLGHLEQAVMQFNANKRAKRSDEEIKEFIIKELERKTTNTSETSYRVGTKIEASAKADATDGEAIEKPLTYNEKVRQMIEDTNDSVVEYVLNFDKLSSEEKEASKKEVSSKIVQINNSFGENKDVQSAISDWQEAIKKPEDKEKALVNEINTINSEVLKFTLDYGKLNADEQKNSKEEINKRVDDFLKANQNNDKVPGPVKAWKDAINSIEPLNQKI